MDRILDNKYMYLIDDEKDKKAFTVYFPTEDLHKVDTTFAFYISDDFRLIALQKERSPEENGRLELTINRDNLFYGPLLKFFRGDSSVIIEDDMSMEKYGKKLTFKRDEHDNIQIVFEYLLKDYPGEFSVNIKNIFPDGRSKIDQNKLDTKNRLFDLYVDLRTVFMNYKKDNPEKVLK
jgi:hypothetical protein